MQRSIIETILGAVVLGVAALFLYLAYQATQVTRSSDGYSLVGVFGAIDGLTLGADVRIGGVKVGTVTRTSIDPELYMAKVGIRIQRDIKVPSDSRLSIVSDGLLGGRYVKLEPGREATLLQEGEEIVDTHDVVALEDLLGRAIFLITDE